MNRKRPAEKKRSPSIERKQEDRGRKGGAQPEEQLPAEEEGRRRGIEKEEIDLESELEPVGSGGGKTRNERDYDEG